MGPPEHDEDVRLAKHSSEVSMWTVEDIENFLMKEEKLAGFHVKGNRLAAHKAWAFVLFPDKDQDRDSDRFPRNYVMEHVIGRNTVFFNNLRALLTRIDSLESNKKPSTDVNGDEFTLEYRIRRLVKVRQNMFEQCRLGEDNYNFINTPTLAIDNTDMSLRDDKTNTSYQTLLLYLLRTAYENGYRRYKDQCFIQIGNTRAWRPVKEIKDFVYDSTQKEDNPEMWKHLTSRGSIVNDVVRHLANCKDFQFLEIKKDRHTWSFKNGLLCGKYRDEDSGKFITKFYPYTSREFRELDPTLVSCKYFDLEFDSFESVEDWWGIPTPHLQRVMDYQHFDIDVSKWLYVFMGRLCFEVGDLDGWQVIPFLKGIARSGKSTIITKVCRKFYECEDVATLSNNIEKKFGLQSIYRGLMFISPEIKGDLQLEQAEFQSLVSGEDVSVARKNDTAVSLQWKTPGILGGNEVPNWKDNSGSILRRLATWNFGRKVMEADPHLDSKLEKEIPAILCKCLRAYLDYAHKYSDKDIWNVFPKYFKEVQRQVATVTSPLHNFFSSEKLRFGADLFVPQEVFIRQFNQHCKQVNLGTFKFNQDFYQEAFSEKNITVRTESLIYKGNAYATQPFIFGLDFMDLE